MTILSKKIRYCRKLQNLTQEDLARLAGLTKDYISKIERGEHTNPRRETLEVLAKALKIEISDFFIDAPLDKNLSNENKNLVRDNWPPGAVPAPSYTPDDIPIVGLARAGKGGFFGADGLPVTDWDKKTHRPDDVDDPNAYALRIDGDSMEPFLRKGHTALCVTDKEPAPGDYVVVQLNSDEVMIKEYTSDGKAIVLKSINPLHAPIVLQPSQVRAIHPVVWIKRK